MDVLVLYLYSISITDFGNQTLIDLLLAFSYKTITKLFTAFTNGQQQNIKFTKTSTSEEVDQDKGHKPKFHFSFQ